MKIFLSIVFFLIFGTANSQCYELLSNKIDSMEIIPYYLHDKLVDEVESGKTIVVTIRDVEYKSKRFFLFQQNDLGDTLDVALMTLNKKVLARKYITKDDYILRCDPFWKSGNYFLVITTKKKLDDINKPVMGCLGIAILERLTKRPFKKIQKIEWKVED